MSSISYMFILWAGLDCCVLIGRVTCTHTIGPHSVFSDVTMMFVIDVKWIELQKFT